MIFTENRIKFYTFFPIVFSVLIFLLSSCKSSQPVTSNPKIVEPAEVKPEIVKEPEKEKPATITTKFNVAVILPFDLKSNFQIDDQGIVDPEIQPASLPALNFYEGALLAVDSLKSKNKDVKLTAFEAPSDSLSLVKLFSQQKVKDAGLVIASLPSALAQTAAVQAEKHGINLFLTQSSSPEFLQGNKNTALTYSSTITQCKSVVNSLLSKNRDVKIFLIYRNLKREDELAKSFRAEILKLKQENEFKDINATDKGYADVISGLSKTKRNLIFVVSSDEAFISPLLTKMEEQEIYGIHVCGLPTWQNFESIDFMNFKNIQVIVFDNNFINYESPERIVFRKNFISKYFSDPLPSAFNGFDLIYKTGLAAESNKTPLSKVIEKSFGNNNDTFNFQNFEGGGYENKQISILKYNDYKLEIIPEK